MDVEHSNGETELGARTAAVQTREEEVMAREARLKQNRARLDDLRQSKAAMLTLEASLPAQEAELDRLERELAGKQSPAQTHGLPQPLAPELYALLRRPVDDLHWPQDVKRQGGQSDTYAFLSYQQQDGVTLYEVLVSKELLGKYQ